MVMKATAKPSGGKVADHHKHLDEIIHPDCEPMWEGGRVVWNKELVPGGWHGEIEVGYIQQWPMILMILIAIPSPTTNNNLANHLLRKGAPCAWQAREVSAVGGPWAIRLEVWSESSSRIIYQRKLFKGSAYPIKQAEIRIYEKLKLVPNNETGNGRNQEIWKLRILRKFRNSRNRGNSNWSNLIKSMETEFDKMDERWIDNSWVKNERFIYTFLGTRNWSRAPGSRFDMFTGFGWLAW